MINKRTAKYFVFESSWFKRQPTGVWALDGEMFWRVYWRPQKCWLNSGSCHSGHNFMWWGVTSCAPLLFWVISVAYLKPLAPGVSRQDCFEIEYVCSPCGSRESLNMWKKHKLKTQKEDGELKEPRVHDLTSFNCYISFRIWGSCLVLLGCLDAAILSAHILQ